MGTMRTGWTLFKISPRNSPQAVSHLLSKTGATYLFVSVEDSIQSLADAAIKQLAPDSVQKCAMPTYDALFPTGGVDPSFTPEPLGEFRLDDDGLVLHSSGWPMPTSSRSLC